MDQDVTPAVIQENQETSDKDEVARLKAAGLENVERFYENVKQKQVLEEFRSAMFRQGSRCVQLRLVDQSSFSLPLRMSLLRQRFFFQSF